MKKIVTITTLLILIVMLLGVTVKAVTASSLVDDLYALGKKYGVNEEDKVKANRYLTDNPITDEQWNSRSLQRRQKNRCIYIR